nr:unnamed protein product [Callosobruchus chinensis]
MSDSYVDYMPFFIICDVAYLLHFVLLVVHRTQNKTKEYLTEVVESPMICLVADCVSLLPLVMVLTPFFNKTYTNLTLLFRMICCLRLRTVAYFGRKQSSAFRNMWIWCVAETVVLLSLIIYGTNLTWFVVENEVVMMSFHEFQHLKSPGDNHSLEYLGSWHLFFTHISTQVLFSAGLQDYNISTKRELYYFLLLTLVGQLFFIAMICSFAWNLIHHNFYQVEDSKKIQDLSRYLQSTDTNVRKKIGSHYKIIWKEEKGYFKETLLKMVPESLQKDILYDMSCGLLNRSLILKDLPPMVQRMLSVKTVTLQAGECAFHQYVVKCGMVCVEDGILEILHHEDEESPVMSLAKGSILGEIALIFNIPAKATVRALSNTKLIILEKSDFLETMLDYPELLQSIQNALEKRIDDVIMNNRKGRKEGQNLKRLKMQISSIHDFQGYVEVIVNVPNIHLRLYKLSKKNLTNAFSWIVHADCIMLEVWRVVHSLLQVILCIMYPYYVTFVKRVPYWLTVYVRTADFFCVSNLIVQCLTISNIREQRRLKDIINEHMDDWTVNLDVLSVLPIEIWSYFFKTVIDRDKFYDVLQLNRLLRLYHLKYIFKQDYSWKMRVFKCIFYLALFIYYYSCMLYLYACFYEICDENSWFLVKLFQLSQSGLAPINHSLLMIYYVTISFFRTAKCMIFPKTDDVLILITLLTICALLLKSYFLAEIISHAFMTYATEGWITINFKLKRLAEMYSITRPSSNRLKQYMTLDSYYCKTNSEHFISETCPKHLKQLVHSSKIGDSLCQIPLFQLVDSYFLTLVIKCSKVIRIPKTEIIYYYGDVTRQFFVLISGCCEVYNSEDIFEKIVTSVCDLGTLEAIFGIPKKYTVIAASDCDLVMIDYCELHKVLKLFSKEKNAIDTVRDRSDLRQLVDRLDEGRTVESYPYRDYMLTGKSVMNLTRNPTGYWKVYKQNWGTLWFLSWILLPLSVYPDGIFFKMWCIKRSILVTIICILQPITLATTTYEVKLYWIIWICQLSLYLDIYINLHVAVYEKGHFRCHPAYTARHYLTHSFVLDLIAAVPWETLAVALTSTKYYKYCRMVKLIQMHRMISCITYFESERYRPRTYLKIMKLLMLILFTIHLLACVLVKILCLEDTGTVSSQAEANKSVGAEKNACTFKKYLVSFQTSTHLLSNTGFSDFEAWSAITMSGTILSIIAGFTMFSIFTAIIVALILENQRNTLKFRQEAENLMKFFENKNLKKSFRRRASEHLTLLWERTKGLNEDYLKELSVGPKLTEDIFLNRYQHVLREACFFSDVFSSTIKIFVGEMQIYHFRKGEAIVRANDVISHIFFLVSGQVEVRDEHNNYIRMLETASVFGNLQRGRYLGSKLFFTARRNVELCALRTERFLNLAKMHQNLFLRIEGYFDRKKDYLLPLAGEIDLLRGLKKQSSQFYDLESDDEVVSNKKFPPSITNKSSLQFLLVNRWFKFGLKPDHKIFEVIDVATLIATFVNLLIIPYLFVTQDASPYYYAELALEPVYYLRVFMKFHQGFVSYYGNLICSNSKIAKRYLNSPQEVFWDVVPNIPLELLCFTFHPEDWFFFDTCFRLIHILRIYYIRNYFLTHDKTLVVMKWLPLVKVTAYGVLCVHFVSCIFLFAACPFGNCSSETWIQSISGTNEIGSNDRMLLTYLYVTTLMISTDIGSIVMKRWFEIFFCSVIILVGKVMTAVFIGNVIFHFFIHL